MEKVFIAPFVAYLLGTQLISLLDEAWYPVGYSAVVVVIMIGFVVLLRQAARGQLTPEQVEAGATPAAAPLRLPFRVHASVLPGVVVGVVGIGLWIGLCELELERTLTSFLPSFLRPGERVSYNPLDSINTLWGTWAFVAVRIVGLAIVVPVAEELFWRGFLLRWLIDPAWQRVPVGEFSLESCLIVTLMFTLAHPEWFAAAVYCLLINGLLYWKRDLWQCVVAHAVSNFLLAVYVLNYDQWQLW